MSLTNTLRKTFCRVYQGAHQRRNVKRAYTTGLPAGFQEIMLNWTWQMWWTANYHCSLENPFKMMWQTELCPKGNLSGILLIPKRRANRVHLCRIFLCSLLSKFWPDCFWHIQEKSDPSLKRWKRILLPLRAWALFGPPVCMVESHVIHGVFVVCRECFLVWHTSCHPPAHQ